MILIERTAEASANVSPTSKSLRHNPRIGASIAGIVYEFAFFVGISTDEHDNLSFAAMRQNLVAIVVSSLVVGIIVFVVWYRWLRRT